MRRTMSGRLAVSIGQGGLVLLLSLLCAVPSALAAGACCFSDGTCEVLDEGTCVAEAGYWLGEETDCDPNPCPDLPGACCRYDRLCWVQVLSDCLWVWMGYGVPCDPNPCPVNPGACCFLDGHCELLTSDECLALSYAWWFGQYSSCDPNPCPVWEPEACCFADGHCELLVGVVCADQGGWPLGPLTCDPNPCPQYDSGACCFADGHCEFLTGYQCDQAGGMWWLPDVPCEIEPCGSTPRKEESWGRIKERYR